MTTLYLTEPYSTITKDGDTLLVKIPANEEAGTPKRTQRIPLLKIDQVVVMGNSTVTTPAALALLERNADICFCDYWGKFKGRLSPPAGKNIYIRTAQFEAHQYYRQRVELGARFVRGKLHNQRTLLLRSNRKIEDEEQAAFVGGQADRIGRLIQEVDGLIVGEDAPPDARRPQKDSALGRLQGMEGAAAAAFFPAYARLLKQDLGFTKRKRRPPTDPVNALLSFGYVLLMNHVMSAVHIVGLDPYIGFLHSPGYGKPALALDLMEEMRTPVVESVVLSVINKQIVTGAHFEAQFGAYRLTGPGRKRFLQQFEQRLNTEIVHPYFGYKATYRRCLELQVRLLAKSLVGEIPHYKAFQVR
jgi:CRISPR-associated protein Cas1